MMAIDTNRDKALTLVFESIHKAYGKGVIMRLGDGEVVVKMLVILIGSISLDLALGVGGYFHGRIIEIYGPESSGKMTFILHAIVECQKQGGIAVFIDVEHALDLIYARKLGVNVDELFVSQPDHGEQAFEIADIFVCFGVVDLIVIDFVAAFVPKAEIEGEMGDSHVGLQARLMSQVLCKLTVTVKKSDMVLFFINQIRHKIGVMFGSLETIIGGNALKFYVIQRFDICRIGVIKVGDQVIGNRIRVKVVKNKVVLFFQMVEFDILFGHGISRTGDVLDLGVVGNFIDKAGAWYSYKKDCIGQGRDNARRFFEEHFEMLAEIEVKIFEANGLGLAVDVLEAKAEVLAVDGEVFAEGIFFTKVKVNGVSRNRT